jgi:LEA14-like dessication related protein
MMPDANCSAGRWSYPVVPTPRILRPSLASARQGRGLWEMPLYESTALAGGMHDHRESVASGTWGNGGAWPSGDNGGKSMRRLMLWLGIAVSLAACASADHPAVNLVSVKLASLSLFEQRFVTTLRIQNPSSAELALEGISVEIELNGNTFARGVRPGALVIPAYGQDTVGVETISTTSGIVRNFRALARTGDVKLNYRLTGRLQPRDRPDAIAFDDKGVISLSDLGS